MLRIGTSVISFAYLVLLAPHLAGISSEHFKRGLVLAAIATALVWIPLLLLHDGKIRVGDRFRLGLSLLLPVVMLGFFAFLYGAATAVH